MSPALAILAVIFLLSRKQVSGWVVKIIGGIAWIIFLLQSQNIIFGTVTVVVVTSMVYGFYKWQTGKNKQRTKIDIFFGFLTVAVAIFMISRFLMSGDYQLAPIFETWIVIAEITATILIAYKIVYGWYFYIIMSLLAAVLVIFINTDSALILGILELCSIYFYYKGIKKFAKK